MTDRIVEWVLHHDLRAPVFGAPAIELYQAAIEQAAWADEHGCSKIMVSEHHGSDDGYLPSPLVFMAGVATRTKRARLRVSALVLPLRDPVQAAEDVIVLDHLSDGRIEVICAAGYVPSEFAMFGADFEHRAHTLDEHVRAFTQALTGEPFEHRGETIRVTPPPIQRPRPPVLLGGSTLGSARRAARLGDGFMPAIPDPALYDAYLSERTRLGKDPGDLTRPSGPFFVHVARDPDAAWAKIAPHALHEMNEYARWASFAPGANPYVPMDDPDMLRAQGIYAVVTPDECVAIAEQIEDGAKLILKPLMGGMAPDLGWESLELFAAEVLPRLSSGAGPA
jgi:alkanesulfonate monooxygenase SsuD/methylene tetrahydromethanopterin reductase-like flavin-dependent oxidoreductase (luciferase family)